MVSVSEMEMALLTPGQLWIMSLGGLVSFDRLCITASGHVTMALFLEILSGQTPEEHHPLTGKHHACGERHPPDASPPRDLEAWDEYQETSCQTDPPAPPHE